MLRPTRAVVTTALCGSFLVGGMPAAAAPITFAGNAYEFVAGAYSFDEADAAAQAQTFDGVNGHLVTITSAEENAFILSLIASIQHSVWIGATDRASEGEWRWVTGQQFWQGNAGGTAGPDVSYANWASGQPDDFDTGQDVATIFGGLVAGLAGTWDDGGDGPGTDGSIYQRDGYLVEFEQVSSVPEPASLTLLGFGLVGMGARRWRQRKQ